MGHSHCRLLLLASLASTLLTNLGWADDVGPRAIWSHDKLPLKPIKLERALAAYTHNLSFLQESSLAVAFDAKNSEVIHQIAKSYQCEFALFVSKNTHNQVVLTVYHVPTQALRNHGPLLDIPKRLTNNFYRGLALKVSNALEEYPKPTVPAVSNPRRGRNHPSHRKQQ